MSFFLVDSQRWVHGVCREFLNEFDMSRMNVARSTSRYGIIFLDALDFDRTQFTFHLALCILFFCVLIFF